MATVSAPPCLYGPPRSRLRCDRVQCSSAGPAATILEAWRSERFALLVSRPILDEVARVLAYPKIARRHGWSKAEDDRYLECALEGRAEYIESGDHHLLALRTYRDSAIVSPRAFLAILPAAR